MIRHLKKSAHSFTLYLAAFAMATSVFASARNLAPPQRDRKGGVGTHGKPTPQKGATQASGGVGIHGGKIEVCFKPEGEMNSWNSGPDYPWGALLRTYLGPSEVSDNAFNVELYRGHAWLKDEYYSRPDADIVKDIALSEFYDSLHEAMGNPLFGGGSSLAPWPGPSRLACDQLGGERFPGLYTLNQDYGRWFSLFQQNCKYVPQSPEFERNAPFELIFETLLDEFKTVPEFYLMMKHLWLDHPGLGRIDDTGRTAHSVSTRHIMATDDALGVGRPEGCAELQAVQRSGTQFSYDPWLWHKLDPLQRALLELHEVLYEIGVQPVYHHGNDAEPTRAFIKAFVQGAVENGQRAPMRGQALADALANAGGMGGELNFGRHMTAEMIEKQVRQPIVERYNSAIDLLTRMKGLCDERLAADSASQVQEVSSRMADVQSDIDRIFNDAGTWRYNVANPKWSDDETDRHPLESEKRIGAAMLGFADDLLANQAVYNPLDGSVRRGSVKSEFTDSIWVQDYCAKVPRMKGNLILKRNEIERFDYLNKL